MTYDDDELLSECQRAYSLGITKKAGNFNLINISTLLKRLDLEIAFVLMLFCLQNEIGLDPGLGNLIHQNFSEPILHTRYLECFLLISSPSNQQVLHHDGYCGEVKLFGI